MNNLQGDSANLFDKKLSRILKKIYENEERNYSYDESKKIRIYRLPKSLTENEKNIFECGGRLLNDIKHYTHDGYINNIKMITQSEEMKTLVTRLFLMAVGEGFHRGLQPIISYYYAINVPEHQYDAYCFDPKKYHYSKNDIPCRVCGLTKECYDNISETIYELSIGYCRLESSYDYLTDIQDVAKTVLPQIDEKWLRVLSTLLKAIEEAPQKETPSELEKRISKLKILPNSTHCSRTWLLRILSMLGIIPNNVKPGYSISKGFVAFDDIMEYDEIMQNEAVNHRSEVSWPYSAWRGEMGINIELAFELFPELRDVY